MVIQKNYGEYGQHAKNGKNVFFGRQENCIVSKKPLSIPDTKST